MSSIGYSENEETGALRALGIVWRRENITWRQNGVLLGRQYTQSEPVDFSAQIGVYLLYDRDRVIYVGRAVESLYTRLLAHTTDRMEGRWDRFLWFGLKAVNDDASLSNTTPKWTHHVVIETLEAALIETVEPPQNRRRGDNFAAVEYLQLKDPEIQKKSRKELLAKLLADAQ